MLADLRRVKMEKNKEVNPEALEQLSNNREEGEEDE